MLYATPSPAAIRAQLASVMEALASAAVADIYKVVEQSCVTLRLEITRSQKENAVLRSKMQTLELHIAQLTAQRAGEVDGGAGAPRMAGSNKGKMHRCNTYIPAGCSTFTGRCACISRRDRVIC